MYSLIKKQHYIAVHKKYIPLCGSLNQKILYVLQTMIENENGWHKYPVKGFSNDISLQDMYEYISRYSKNELYFVENAEAVVAIHSFLLYFPIENLETWEYYENHVPSLHIANMKYMRIELWLEQLNDIIERLEDILDSFEYNYNNLRNQGRNFYEELSKYVCNPTRIARISKLYDISWDEYLDIIDL